MTERAVGGVRLTRTSEVAGWLSRCAGQPVGCPVERDASQVVAARSAASLTLGGYGSIPAPGILAPGQAIGSAGPGQGVARDRGRRGDVQRVDPGRHRDAYSQVAGRKGARGESFALGAEQQRDLL